MSSPDVTSRWYSEALRYFLHTGVRKLLIMGVLLSAASCVTTKPWHRETLSKPVMAPDGDEDRAALRGHLISVREGAVGASGGGGGGCGCN